MDTVESLSLKVREAFPELEFSAARLVDKGEDHVVLVLDNKWIFRFPRTAEYQKTFHQELRLLKELEARTQVAVPNYKYVSANQDFGGYRLIVGEELTPNLFRTLSSESTQAMSQELAGFLSALHELPSQLIDVPETSWSLASYRDRWVKDRRSIVKEAVEPSFLEGVDRFYASFVEIKPPLKSIIHEDLSSDHILLAPDEQHLAGIIDFGDVAYGDPALDFSFFWSYGEDFLRNTAGQYRSKKDDRFIDRSRWYFVRFLVDELYYFVKDKKEPQVQETMSMLAEHISRL